MAAKKKSVKKTIGKKKVAKKSVKRAPAKKAPAKKTAAKKSAGAARVEKITPTRDGAEWTLLISGGAKAKVPAAAAQTVGIRVGSAWSDAVHARIGKAVAEQALFTRAMDALASGGKTTPAALVKLLGGDAAARATVAALRKTGWIG